MTDLDLMRMYLETHNIHDAQDILDRNQNRGCGGDDSFNEDQWMAARDAIKAMRDFLKYEAEFRRLSKDE